MQETGIIQWLKYAKGLFLNFVNSFNTQKLVVKCLWFILAYLEKLFTKIPNFVEYR